MQSILVKGQHEHNENKKSIENTEEENGLVSQFGQTFFDLRLLKKEEKCKQTAEKLSN